MPEFSMEILKKKDSQEHDPRALRTLQILKERIKGRDLFHAVDEEEFERLKNLFPNEYAILENDEAFNDKTEAEKRQILFNTVNPDNIIDVSKAKVIGTIE